MPYGAIVLRRCNMRGASNANPNENLLLFWGCSLLPCLCETKVFQTGWIPFETEILKRPDDGGLHYGVEKLHMNGKKAPTALSTVRRRHRITRSPSWTGMSRSWASFASERFAGLCMLCFACLPFIALCSCASSSLAAFCAGDCDFRQATSLSSRLKAVALILAAPGWVLAVGKELLVVLLAGHAGQLLPWLSGVLSISHRFPHPSAQAHGTLPRRCSAVRKMQHMRSPACKRKPKRQPTAHRALTRRCKNCRLARLLPAEHAEALATFEDQQRNSGIALRNCAGDAESPKLATPSWPLQVDT